MTASNKEVLLELEYLRADLDLLRQEADYISQCMKQQSLLVNTMAMTLKGMQENK